MESALTTLSSRWIPSRRDSVARWELFRRVFDMLLTQSDTLNTDGLSAENQFGCITWIMSWCISSGFTQQIAGNLVWSQNANQNLVQIGWLFVHEAIYLRLRVLVRLSLNRLSLRYYLTLKRSLLRVLKGLLLRQKVWSNNLTISDTNLVTKLVS